MAYITNNEALELLFPKLYSFEMVEPLLRHRDPNMTQNGHVCMIY